jgi:ribulose-5-phosphate 4-epimerase/fuculose-1-phosphate aldolase
MEELGGGPICNYDAYATYQAPVMMVNDDRTSQELLAEARINLAAAHRLAVGQGFSEAICNHFTLAVPGNPDSFLLIPYGLHWSEVRAKDFLVVSYDGQIIQGSGIAEPTAFYIHAPLHRARPDAACVLHTHMPFATALTMLEEPRLEMASQTSLMFAGRIAYDRDYHGLAVDDAEGQRLAGLLGRDQCVLFLANHGVIVIGTSVAEAYDRLYFLERACQTQILALSTGRRLKYIPDDVVTNTVEQQRHLKPGNRPIYIQHFEALKRILDSREPDYAKLK